LAYIKSVTVDGLRGVSGELPLHLAIPDGRPGSGLTILVGANNSGKSTVVEAFEALSKSRGNAPTFSIGKRNAYNPNHLIIHCTFVGDEQKQNWLELVYGGSETRWRKRDVDPDITVIPSRRGFEPYFEHVQIIARESYNAERPTPRYRPQALDATFARRLFKINAEGDRPVFDEMLGRLMGEPPKWTIDQMDTGQHFIKFHLGQPQFYHSSEGVGDGIISLFVIATALYELFPPPPQRVVVIDEPELSLHPYYQRRLRNVLSELSSDHQIVCATHSPYFVNWRDVENGAEITRAYKNAEYNIRLARAPREALQGMLSLESDNNPHALGLNASEVFFLDDHIIITEGQEDVVYFENISTAIDMQMSGEFYGWGAGGATNIRKVCRLLDNLDYTKVVGIFDADQPEAKAQCEAEFPDYRFVLLPADDIRDKAAVNARPAKSGLWKSGEGLDESKRAGTVAMYNDINTYLTGQAAAGEPTPA
jgi:energy-coupling factor transporter ATP-binding protein EcfA2